jgi:hypothetical protein
MAHALFGAPLPLDDCAGSAVAAMVELIEQFNHERKAADKASSTNRAHPR